MADFEAAFSAKTRVFVLNNPHNPLGKVFTTKELSDIANVVRANHITSHHIT